MDVVIAYERVQVLSPRMNFLGRFSIKKIAFVAFVLSLLVNVPVNVGRELQKKAFRIESNKTTILRTYGKIICI
jgi:hypothetical protein